MKSTILTLAMGLGLLPWLSLTMALPEPAADAVDIEYMRRNHRLTSVPGGPHPPGPVAMYKAYHKHGISIPSHLERAAKAAAAVQAKAARSAEPAPPKGAGVATGQVNGPDNGWLFPVTMGKTTNLKMVFDTGSADLWVFSTLTPQSQRGSHKIYNPSATGKIIQGEKFAVTYGKGAASGVVYADKVVAGDITATAAVGAATSVAAFNTASTNDGIMGFAFINENTCSPNSCNPWWLQAYPQWPQPIWGVALRHASTAIWDFGFIDKSLYTGSIVYTEQMNQPYVGAWGIFVQGYSTGANQQTKTNFYALADTGTTLLLLLSETVNAYYAKVPGAVYDASQGGVVFPCSSTSKLPNLNFFLDGQKRTMPGAYGRYTAVNATYCFGAIQSKGNSPISILGDAFLKSQYVVYNPRTNVVGFAQQKGVKI